MDESPQTARTKLALEAPRLEPLQQPASECDRLTDMALKDSSPLDARTDARPPLARSSPGRVAFLAIDDTD
jgi:hypothetical protein